LPTVTKAHTDLNEAGSPSPTTRLRGPQRRDEILTAAEALYVTHGPAKTTTRQIAEAVGISQPSLYAHFPTKDALSYALAERSFAILEERMVKFEPLYEDPKTHLEELVKGYIAYALEEPSAYKIAFMLDLDIDLASIISLQEHCGLRAFSIFKQKIALLQAQNFIKAGPLDIVAQSIWAAMHGLCALLLSRPHFPWAQRAELIAAHTDLIVRGAQA
jgi:AcrR family transcriptional regulator